MPHPGWSAFRFEGIGTHWEISTPDPLGRDLRQRVLAAVEEYDRTYSRFRSDSVVAALGPMSFG